MVDSRRDTLINNLSHGWAFDDLKEQMDSSSLMLLFLSRYGHMPELYAELGRRNFLRFIKAFGGARLVVPTERELGKAITQVHIYTQLQAVPTTERLQMRQILADRYGVSRSEILGIYNQIDKELATIQKNGATIAEVRRIEGQNDLEESIDALERIYRDND